jgi:DNA-binding NarL/FixJ family response regulator
MPFNDPLSVQPGVLVVLLDRLQLLLRRTRSTDLPPHLRRVLTRLCVGKTTDDIANELRLTLATTRLYINRMSVRLGTTSRSELILRAIELGLNHKEHA